MKFAFPKGFDPQPNLSGDGLILKPLDERDHGALAKAASDPGIWAGHPSKTRHTREVFDPYFAFLVSTGGALAIVDDGSDEIIGCSAFYTDTNAFSRLSIGFTFLTRKYWGGQTNRALKRLMAMHVFESASEVWFHIAPSNLRSQAATRKLGAVFTHEDDVDLGGGAQRWQCFCLTREAWSSSFGSATY